jgi:hypothetical protein
MHPRAAPPSKTHLLSKMIQATLFEYGLIHPRAAGSTSSGHLPVTILDPNSRPNLAAQSQGLASA